MVGRAARQASHTERHHAAIAWSCLGARRSRHHRTHRQRATLSGKLEGGPTSLAPCQPPVQLLDGTPRQATLQMEVEADEGKGDHPIGSVWALACWAVQASTTCWWRNAGSGWGRV